MEIYIEIFLIQNILINFCLLKLVCVSTKQNTTFFKLLVASTIGAGFSVFSAIVIINTYLLNIIKLACAIIMIMLAFKQSKKQFITNLILLFVYTFALGGAITNLCSTTYQTSFGLIMSSKFSLELICVVIIILTYIIEMVAKHHTYRAKTNNYIFPILLEQNSNKIKINAYLDTGNLLSFNGNPVIVLDLDCYLKLTKTNLINFYLSKSEKINTGTVTGTNNLKIFKLDKITIFKGKNKIELNNQYIAVNANNSFKNTNYQALLSPLMI